MNSYAIEKILVPVDLSDTSLNALRSAVSISKQYGASIQVLNVTEKAFALETGTNAMYSGTTSDDVLFRS